MYTYLRRDPEEVMRSMHAQRIYNGTEDLPFDEALEAEPDRIQGKRLPTNTGWMQAMFYRRLVDFDTQIERYRKLFRDVHVIQFDELKRNPLETFWGVCDFLGNRHQCSQRARAANVPGPESTRACSH